MSNIDDEVDSFFEDMLQEENAHIQNLGERYIEKEYINQATFGFQTKKQVSSAQPLEILNEFENTNNSISQLKSINPLNDSNTFITSINSSINNRDVQSNTIVSHTISSNSDVIEMQISRVGFSEEYIKNPQHFLQSIQRDLNKLSSNERNYKIGALQKLRPIFKECLQHKNVVLYIFRFIYSVFVQLLEDQLESLREFGCNTLLNLFQVILTSNPNKIIENNNLTINLSDEMQDIPNDDSSGNWKDSMDDIQYSNTIQDQLYECLSLLIPVLSTKLLNNKNTHQAEENSEEVRVLMMHLFSFIIQNFDVGDYLKIIFKVIRDRLEDNYHQIKIESCQSIVTLCHVFNGKYKYYLDKNTIITKLIKSLNSSLNHQRHTVRSEAVLTLYELVMIRPGGDSLKDLSKIIRKLASDNSKEVRENLLNVCEKWFINHIDTYSYQDIFITPILIMHSDELDTIQQLALKSMDNLGKKHEEWNEDKLKDQLEYVYEDMNEEISKLPTPFITRPCLGSRLIVKHNLKNLLSLIFDNLGDWSIQQKEIYSQLLKVVIVYSEKDITQHMDKMLQNWFKIVSEQELEIAKNLEEAIQLAGKYCDPDSYLPHIYSFLQSQYATSPSTLTNVLKVFSLIVRGSTTKGILLLSANHLKISEELQASHLIYHDDKKVVLGVLNVVVTLIQLSPKMIEQEALKYFFLLHKIWAQNSNRTVSDSIVPTALELLASNLNLDNTSQLYRLFFKIVIDELVKTRDLWEKNSPELFTFELVVKQGIVHVPEHSSFIFSHLKTLTQKGRDGNVVSTMFSVMEFMFQKVGDRVKDDLEIIVFDIIGPNLPWSAGKSKLNSRLLGLSCLNVILSQDLCNEDLLRRIVKDFHNNIVSMLDEFDDKMRLFATNIIPLYLKKVRSFLNDKDWDKCYKVLIELFDDKLDQVRVQSFIALRSLFQYCPYDVESITGAESVKKLVETLFIHLDDLNRNVHFEVFETIDQLKQSNPQWAEIIKILAQQSLSGREFQNQQTKILIQRLLK